MQEEKNKAESVDINEVQSQALRTANDPYYNKQPSS